MGEVDELVAGEFDGGVGLAFADGEVFAGAGEGGVYGLVEGLAVHDAVGPGEEFGFGADQVADLGALGEGEGEFLEAFGAVDGVEESGGGDVGRRAVFEEEVVDGLEVVEEVAAGVFYVFGAEALEEGGEFFERAGEGCGSGRHGGAPSAYGRREFGRCVMAGRLTDAQVLEAADFLDAAAAAGGPMGAIPESCRPGTGADGGRILMERWSRNPREAVAWKAAEAGGQFVLAPFFEGMVRESPAEFAAGDFNFCVVEAEVAFRMGRGLEPAAGVREAEEVLDAVEAAFLAIEAPNIRYADGPRAGLPSIAADGIGAQALILGPEIPDWRERDLAELAVVIEANGEQAAEGRAKEERPDPVGMLTRFANALSEQGRTLEAGQAVTTGAAALVAPGVAGTTYVVRADGVGEVVMSLT